MRRIALLALPLLMAACGGDGQPSPSGGTGTGGTYVPPPVVPSTHILDVGGGSRVIAAGGHLVLGPFALPAGATVTYSITDTPTGFGADTMDFAVAAYSMASNPTSVQIQGYGVENNVATVSTTTVALPAGSYGLFCICANLVDSCIFADTISAFY